MTATVQEITNLVEKESRLYNQLRSEINKIIVGQQNLVDKLLIGLLADGHILVEGVPGLAKTTAIKSLAQAINAHFQRLQFTPDLLPADLVGTQIYSPQKGEFSVKKGPLFANLILADEINRAPAKVQSALLEAMQEKQVTIADQTFSLPHPFLVMATQNPVEQEGTYPLPEAQVDRFMLKVKVDYPNKTEEIQIMKRFGHHRVDEIRPVVQPAQIIASREVVRNIYIDEKLYDYIANVVFVTRFPAQFGLKDLASLIEYGASPRASIFLVRAAQAHAFLKGRGYVTPQDIKLIGPDVLRHRVIISYEAEAQDITSEEILNRIFDKVDVP